MKSRNVLTLVLMSASILLLLILQVLWLQNSYEKAFNDLRRDSNYLFRNTLFAIRDSLFLKNVQLLPDSFPSKKIESLQVFKSGEGDSVQLSMRSSSIQVLVKSSTGNNDSIIDALRPMAQNFNFQAHDGKRFIIQLAHDTISKDTLKVVFTKALEKAGLPVNFLIHHEFTPDEEGPLMRMRRVNSPFESLSETSLTTYRDTMNLESVRFNIA